MRLKVCGTGIAEVLVVEPQVHSDDRGFFYESFNEKSFCEAIGSDLRFVQDNQSSSLMNVLRGLHYQLKKPQGKLVRVVSGAIYDVAVDIRQGSPSFGDHIGLELSAVNKRQIWIPEGFAHGFLAISERAEVLYKTTDYYAPEEERCIIWDDPTINIDWPLLSNQPILSVKDSNGVLLKNAELSP